MNLSGNWKGSRFVHQLEEINGPHKNMRLTRNVPYEIRPNSLYTVFVIFLLFSTLVKATEVLDTNKVDVDQVIENLSDEQPSTIGLETTVWLCDTPRNRKIDSESIDAFFGVTTSSLNETLNSSYPLLSIAIKFIKATTISSFESHPATNTTDDNLFRGRRMTQSSTDSSIGEARNRNPQQDGLTSCNGTEILFEIIIDLNNTEVNEPSLRSAVLNDLESTDFVSRIQEFGQSNTFFANIKSVHLAFNNTTNLTMEVPSNEESFRAADKISLNNEIPLQPQGNSLIVIVSASVACLALASAMIACLLLKSKRCKSRKLKKSHVDIHDVEKGGTGQYRKPSRDIGIARHTENRSDYSGMDDDNDDDLTNTHTNVTDSLNQSESLDSKQTELPTSPDSALDTLDISRDYRLSTITPPRMVTEDIGNIPQFSPVVSSTDPTEMSFQPSFKADFDHATFEDVGTNHNNDGKISKDRNQRQSDFTSSPRLSSEEMTASWEVSSIPSEWTKEELGADKFDKDVETSLSKKRASLDLGRNEALKDQMVVHKQAIFNISSPVRAARDLDDHMSYISSPGHSTLAFDTSISILSRLDTDGDSTVEGDGSFPQASGPIYMFGKNQYQPPDASPKMQNKSTSSLYLSSDQSSNVNPMDWSAGDASTLGSVSDFSGLEGKRIWDQYLAEEQRKKKETELLYKVGGHFPPNNISSNASFSTGLSSTTYGTESTGKSKQLMNDILWLEKKIADRAGSFATDDVDDKNRDAPLSPSMQRVVCRDCYAPPGKLNIVIRSSMDGPVVHSVDEASTLHGQLFMGDLIIAVDNVDTRSMRAEQVMKLMQSMIEQERKITVLHFGD